jgi:hypothetical protein
MHARADPTDRSILAKQMTPNGVRRLTSVYTALLVMIFGGILIVAICLCRVLKNTLQQAFVQRIERPLQL